MRRQGRLSAGGALVVRSASALQVWLWLLLFVFQNEFRISRSIQPGYLDFDNLPETNFTCTGKVIGGYYADLETSCQMFHVCTVGQQDEPMDIKFLCLNGTVFDQETRVCERVDEVDCTKSEKFYSLNLELYGSTAPPIIPPEPKPVENEEIPLQSKPSTENTSDRNPSDSSTVDKIQNLTTEAIDSTEDPIQENNRDDIKSQQINRLPQTTTVKDDEEYEEEIDEEYEDDYSHSITTTTHQAITTTTSTTKRPASSTFLPTTSPSPTPHLISSTARPSTISPSSYTTISPSFNPSSTLDPSLLTPQEFIYRHRGPGSEAISFQRQSFRPADGVYITHAPPQQFDHFQYESSRTVPRPTAARPIPFVQRPQPAPFRATTIDPRNQLLRPGPSPQAERHEVSIKQQPKPYPSPLPSQQPLPFNPFFYDRKRSEDSSPEEQSSLSARSVAPIIETERPPVKPKSPPRVIVTASASVSDSNGKRLNYTVGNVVSAVKPIVAINYDDYKESDLIFDPFFLDVPKLQARRKTRSNRNRQIFTVPAVATVPSMESQEKKYKLKAPITHRATTVKASTESPKTTTAMAWNPEDYVDDNYEPHAYVPPLAVLLTRDEKYSNQDKNSYSKTKKTPDHVKVIRDEILKPTQSAVQAISSQSAGTEAAAVNTSPSPLEAPACVKTRSNDCRNRA